MPDATQTARFSHETEATPRERSRRGDAPARAPAAGPGPLADLGLLIARALVGFVMAAHGWQKVFDVGPATFGTSTLEPLGVPVPTTMGYVVAFTELIGGLLLMAGLLTRLAAFALIVDLAFAVALLKPKAPLIVAPDQPGSGLELDLALIGGFAVALLAGPGRVSLDRVFGIDARRRGGG